MKGYPSALAMAFAFADDAATTAFLLALSVSTTYGISPSPNVVILPKRLETFAPGSTLSPFTSMIAQPILSSFSALRAGSTRDFCMGFSNHF